MAFTLRVLTPADREKVWNACLLLSELPCQKGCCSLEQLGYKPDWRPVSAASWSSEAYIAKPAAGGWRGLFPPVARVFLQQLLRSHAPGR